MEPNAIERILEANPWRCLPARSPWALPQDMTIINEFNSRPRLSGTNRVVTDIPPNAFLGSPSEARLVILTKAPSWDDDNIANCDADPNYVSAMRDALTFETADWPFYFLNPAFALTCGYRWWYERLGELVKEARNIRSVDGLQILSQRIFTAAYYPYHCRELSSTAPYLPSQDFTMNLVRALVLAGVPTVIMAHAKQWIMKVPELDGNFIPLKSTQSNHISRNNMPSGQFLKLAYHLMA